MERNSSKKIARTSRPAVRQRTEGRSDDAERAFGLYAKAYAGAAATLASSLLERGLPSYYETFPVIFLYRHALELHLKNIVYTVTRLLGGEMLSEMDKKLLNEHPLAPVAEKAMSLLRTAFPDDKRLHKCFRQLLEMSRTLDKIDRSSFNYRYPIDKHGNPTLDFSRAKDLATFSQRLNDIIIVFETIRLGVDIEIDRAEDASALCMDVLDYSK